MKMAINYGADITDAFISDGEPVLIGYVKGVHFVNESEALDDVNSIELVWPNFGDDHFILFFIGVVLVTLIICDGHIGSSRFVVGRGGGRYG